MKFTPAYFRPLRGRSGRPTGPPEVEHARGGNSTCLKRFVWPGDRDRRNWLARTSNAVDAEGPGALIDRAVDEAKARAAADRGRPLLTDVLRALLNGRLAMGTEHHLPPKGPERGAEPGDGGATRTVHRDGRGQQPGEREAPGEDRRLGGGVLGVTQGASTTKFSRPGSRHPPISGVGGLSAAAIGAATAGMRPGWPS